MSDRDVIEQSKVKPNVNIHQIEPDPKNFDTGTPQRVRCFAWILEHTFCDNRHTAGGIICSLINYQSDFPLAAFPYCEGTNVFVSISGAHNIQIFNHIGP